jgi:nicotinic acid mononucleotide adenylyltransferase
MGDAIFNMLRYLSGDAVMDKDRLFNALRENKIDLYIAATGAGVSVLASLWKRPGASRYLQGYSFPYNEAQLADYLGHPNPLGRSFCSKEVALDMAAESYIRARSANIKQEVLGRTCVGIGISATVATDREHRGEHRVHMVAVTPTKVWHRKTVLYKAVGQAARILDDETITDLMLTMLQEALDLVPGDAVDSLDQVLYQQLHEFPYFQIGYRSADLPSASQWPHVFLAGTFDPLHDGHRLMADIVSNRTIFRLCTVPLHKPVLDAHGILERVATFRAERRPLLLECEPCFINKFLHHPTSQWILGTDTLDRMIDPKWGIPLERLWKTILDTCTTFRIFEREIEGKVLTMEEVLHKYSCPPLVDLVFLKVPAKIPNISSTNLRQASNQS